MNCLALFVCLQLLDAVTTLAFLSCGVEEANPLVRLVLDCAPSPVVGLLWVKLAAVALALYCWGRGRRRLLSRVNVFFVALVAWNLVAVLLQVGVLV